MTNIMIVDDSPIIRRSLRDIFERMGHVIAIEAEDGKEAVEAYDQKKVDLITMDIQLPGIDGIEAVRQIRERNPQALIVMISSVEHRSKVYEAIKFGAKHYIVKPFSEEKVREVVNSVLMDPPGRKRNMNESRNVEPQQQPLQPANLISTAVKEPLRLDALDLASNPFELTIKDGRAVLTVQKHISDANVQAFHACLQGLLYFRKAKYVIELEEAVYHNEGERLLHQFISAIRARNGTVAVVTADFGYYTQLKAKLRHSVYRTSEEVEW